MKRLIITVGEHDNVSLILEDVGVLVDEGYTSGIDMPVNWHFENTEDHNKKLQNIQNLVNEIRDFNLWVENPELADSKTTEIIESLENWKLNE